MSDAWYTELAERLRGQGFAAVGATEASTVDEATSERLRSAIEQGFLHPLEYLTRPETVAARLDPRERWPWVQSVVAAIFPYNTVASAEAITRLADGGKVSRYAHGEDYHRILTAALKTACREVMEAHPEVQLRYYVDTGPILERYWAAKAGLGFIGKNGLLIVPKWGSWVFLAAILASAPVPASGKNPPVPPGCGQCRRCLDACPTDAFVEPYVLDASKCISCLTLEYRDPFPPGLGQKLDGWVLGCDVCQQVCPWNQRARTIDDARFQPALDLQARTLAGLTTMPAEEFRERFRHTPFWRPGQEGLTRTLRETGSD